MNGSIPITTFTSALHSPLTSRWDPLRCAWRWKLWPCLVFSFRLDSCTGHSCRWACFHFYLFKVRKNKNLRGVELKIRDFAAVLSDIIYWLMLFFHMKCVDSESQCAPWQENLSEDPFPWWSSSLLLLSSSSTSSWCRCTCGLPSWAAAPSSGPPSCASLGRTAMARPVWLSRSSWTHVKLWRRCVRPGWPGRSKRPNGKTKARRKEWKRMPLQSFRLLSRGGKTESSLPRLKPARWELRSEGKQNHWTLSLSVTSLTDVDFEGEFLN